MRKILRFLIVYATIFAILLTVSAAGTELQIPKVTAKPGETVYLNLSLTEPVTGDSMGIEFSYDKSVLEWIPSASSWEADGVLQDLGSYGNSGVWAGGKSMSIEGLVCVLTFKVRENITFTGTEVSCVLNVKNGSEKVGEFTAIGQIQTQCDHEYGAWEDQGDFGHKRGCSLCGGSQTQSHDWTESTKPDPEDERYVLVEKVCKICGATRTHRAAASEEPALPTIPAATQPPEQETVTPGATMPPDAWMPTEPRDDPEKDNTPATVPVEEMKPPMETRPAPTTEPNQDRNDQLDHQSDQSQTGTQNQGGAQSQTGTQNQGGAQSQTGTQNQGGAQNQTGNQNQGGAQSEVTRQEQPEATAPESTAEGDFHVHEGEDGQYIIHPGKEHQDDFAEMPEKAPTGGEGIGEALYNSQIEQNHDHDHTEETDQKRTEGAVAVLMGLAALAGGAWWYLRRRR